MVANDKTISCKECGNAFAFTVGEQEFYAGKGFTHEPTRCKDCRQRRRSSDGGGGYSSYSGGGSSYSSGYSSGDGYSGGGGRREMFPATCSNCGKETQVPFQPRSDKPVYCSDCFETRRSTSPRGGGSSRY